MVTVPDFETSNLDASEIALTSLNDVNIEQQEDDIGRKQSIAITINTKKKVPRVRTA